MKLPVHVPLVVATRGNAPESVWYGSIAVVAASGERLCGVGDIDFPMFTRSTLKPLQALPFVADGGPAHFGFSSAQLAVICGSHSGEPRHVDAVASILARIGCTEDDLQCGSHVPLFYGATATAPPAGLAPRPLQHNCSGKHAGFLAWCRQHGQATDTYLEPDHPLQAAIRRALARVAGCGEAELVAGTDGCSAPNYALPLLRLAQAYARLANPSPESGYEGALAQIFAAMTQHPEMVSGEGRLDLSLAQAVPGDWVAKGGAEGMQAIGIKSRGMGIAIKINNATRRALHVAVAAIIDQLDLLPPGSRPPVSVEDDIVNYAGRHTGRLFPVFRLA